MKKFIAVLSAIFMCCGYSPMCVKAYQEQKIATVGITAENSPELWERFLKYDLCITDYDSLTDDEKELCKFIFETELNSEDTIICERARRTLNGYDVGRRVTLEDTENYYDFADFKYMYSYITDKEPYERPYLYSVPDIKHIDCDVDYNEYWLDDTGSKKILSTGEADGYINFGFVGHYEYVERDENGNITIDNIKRCSVNLETIEDDIFTYAVYPDNTLYVLKANEHLKQYEIPEEVNGMKVVGIKAYAFMNENCYNITLPESIEYIEPLAFAENTLLTSITLPENLKFLGCDNFLNCTSLKDITVDCPDLICDSRTFTYCKAENVFLNFKNIPSYVISSFSSIDNLTFGKDIVKLGTLFANSKYMEDYNYTIPETVKAITNDIFLVYNDYYTEDLIIPETVEVFGAYAVSAGGKIEMNLVSIDSCIAVLDGKCYLSPGVIISGYYGTEAYNYSMANNLTFKPLETEISGYYGTDTHSYAVANNLKFVPLDDLNYGDTNNDGNINIADAVSLQKYLFGNGSVGYEADVNKDGYVDVFDMVEMRKMILNNQ